MPSVLRQRPTRQATLLEHLAELRRRILLALALPAVVCVALLPFANELYEFIARPLLLRLPKGAAMVAVDVASPLMAPMKLAIVVAFVACAPWVLYQLWAFAAPGLYRSERRLVAPLAASSALLFYAGMAFAYAAVLPMAFEFFIRAAPRGVAVMTDIRSYLDFVFGMFIAFGIAFEVPVTVVLLARAGILDAGWLAANRPYVILAVAVASAILTPPDVFSQLFLAFPMYALFELGLLFAPKGRLS